MAIGRSVLSINDWSTPPILPERGTVGVYHEAVLADGSNATAIDTLYQAWKSAVLAVQRGVLVKEQPPTGGISYPVGTTLNQSAITPEAQREEKWEVRMNATVSTPAGGTKIVTYEIPCATLAAPVLGTGGYMDLGAGTLGEALALATNAFVKSREGFDCVVFEVKHVGRNS